MAYGSGTSLSNLSFTPIVAIIIGGMSYIIPNYFFIVAIKGYDSDNDNPLSFTYKADNTVYYSGVKCTFNSNSVSFSDYANMPTNFYNAHIAAFGT